MKRIHVLAAAVAASLSASTFAAAFTQGDLAIYRIGTGSAGLASSGAAVFIDEYSPTGTLVQSIALPTATSGANNALVASGTATSEGLLSLSADGQALVLTGYDRALGTAGSITSTTAASVPRTVGLVDAAGNINTTTALTDVADQNNVRSATSDNGTNIWVAGASNGVRYTTVGSTTSTQLGTITNIRQTSIFGGQLYVSTNSGTTVRIGAVGSGLPMTSPQTITNLPGFPASTGSPYAFFLADLSPSVAGLDTLYVADDSLGLEKFSLVGGNWTANGVVGTAADAYRGLTGIVNGSNVTLYAVRKGGSAAAGGGEYVEIDDTAGYNATDNGTPILRASASANEAFRGITFVPSAAATQVPEPASLGLICLGGLAILGRRKRA